MNTLLKLTCRDIKRTLNLRSILIWLCLSALNVFFFFTSNGKNELIKNNNIEYMTIFLVQIIFGDWAVLSVYFDIVSSDREHNVLDFILCSSVIKKQVFSAKILTTALVSLMLSIIYLLPITIIIVTLSDSSNGKIFLQYCLPLWGYVMVFASMGVTISVLARSSKSALIWSLASGLILMPRLFIMLVDGLGSIFNWSEKIKETVGMIAPGILMESLSDFRSKFNWFTAMIGFTVYILILFIISYWVFCRQDEYNYGE